MIVRESAFLENQTTQADLWAIMLRENFLRKELEFGKAWPQQLTALVLNHQFYKRNIRQPEQLFVFNLRIFPSLCVPKQRPSDLNIFIAKLCGSPDSLELIGSRNHSVTMESFAGVLDLGSVKGEDNYCGSLGIAGVCFFDFAACAESIMGYLG